MNTFSILDRYMGSLGDYDPKGDNFAALVAKAANLARVALVAEGWSAEDASRLVQDAHELAGLAA